MPLEFPLVEARHVTERFGVAHDPERPLAIATRVADEYIHHPHVLATDKPCGVGHDSCEVTEAQGTRSAGRHFSSQRQVTFFSAPPAVLSMLKNLRFGLSKIGPTTRRRPFMD